MESHHDLISSFEHDLRANALRVCREGKSASTFPDHALSQRRSMRGFRMQGFAALDVFIILGRLTAIEPAIIAYDSHAPVAQLLDAVDDPGCPEPGGLDIRPRHQQRH